MHMGTQRKMSAKADGRAAGRGENFVYFLLHQHILIYNIGGENNQP